MPDDAAGLRTDVRAAMSAEPVGLAEMSGFVDYLEPPPASLVPAIVPARQTRLTTVLAKGRRLIIGRPNRPWWRSAEFIVAAVLVVVIGLLGILSRHMPYGLVVQRLVEVKMPQPVPDAGAISLAASPASSIVGSASLPVPRSVQQARLDRVVPALAIEADASGALHAPPPLPALAPMMVAVAYRGSDEQAAEKAAAFATRLRLAGIASTVSSRSWILPGRTGIGYFYEEDRPGALAVAAQLGAETGPVYQLPLPSHFAQAPGTIALVVR